VTRQRDPAVHQVPEPLLVLGWHEGGKTGQQVPTAAAGAAAAASATAVLLLLLLAAAQCCNEPVSKGCQVTLAPVLSR
jgi:hypothetical protein